MPDWKSKCRCGQPLDFAAYDIESGRPQEGSDYWCSDGDPETGPHDQGVIVDNGIERAIAKANERNDCHQCGAPMPGRKCLRCGWIAPRTTKVSVAAMAANPLPQYDDYYIAKGAFQVAASSLTIPSIQIGQGSTLYVSEIQLDNDFSNPDLTVTWNSTALTLDSHQVDALGAGLFRGYVLQNCTAGTGSIVISGGGPGLTSILANVCELRRVKPASLGVSDESGGLPGPKSISLTHDVADASVCIVNCARILAGPEPDGVWQDVLDHDETINFIVRQQ